MQLQFGPSGVITIEDVIIMQLQPNFICGFDAQTVLTCGEKKQNINRKRQKKHEMKCSAGRPGCPFVCDSLNFVLKGTGTRLSQLALLPLNTKRTCSNPGSPHCLCNLLVWTTQHYFSALVFVQGHSFRHL